LKLEKVEQIRGENYDAVDVTILVRDPAGNEQTLRPQRRFYDKSENSNSQVANWSTWRRDAYVTLAGWQDGGKIVAIEMIINPLVAWLWIGGVVMTVGGVLCLLPRLIPHRQTAVQPATTKQTGRSVAPVAAV
jgi:cytochrome c-type biogenesis protein CcmF